jgi:hypothetical protein
VHEEEEDTPVDQDRVLEEARANTLAVRNKAGKLVPSLEHTGACVVDALGKLALWEVPDREEEEEAAEEEEPALGKVAEVACVRLLVGLWEILARSRHSWVVREAFRRGAYPDCPKVASFPATPAVE